jgi:hypothetical protein
MSAVEAVPDVEIDAEGVFKVPTVNTATALHTHTHTHTFSLSVRAAEEA